jgi:alpha-1,2-mannosyltransferase
LEKDQRPRLVLIGGVRNQGDQSIVDSLHSRIQELGLVERIEIIPNASHSSLLEYYSRAIIGLHTMWNEHFGIGIVEYMAAGLVPVAHASGGPLMDIVTPLENEPTGIVYLCYM